MDDKITYVKPADKKFVVGKIIDIDKYSWIYLIYRLKYVFGLYKIGVIWY